MNRRGLRRMPKAKEKKSQHFVPRTYLAAWCDPNRPSQMNDYVWRFSLGASLIGKKSPENLFKETDAYTISMPDGTRNLELEDGLSQLESDFAKIRDKVADHAMLDGNFSPCPRLRSR